MSPSAGDSEALFCLALHLAGKNLSEKNRRLHEIAPSHEDLARILLGNALHRFRVAAEKMLGQYGRSVLLTLADGDYPSLLREISTAPFALFLRGNRQLLQRAAISIVGTREPSAAGRQAAAAVSAWAAAQQKLIVSGIARGVDAIAHHAAIAAGGYTCAVLPNGADHFYPLENRDIYAQALSTDRVLLVSEYAPHEKPQRYQFVKRNRIIAGLSPLTVVIEAGEKSGAMITVGHALDAGRDVAALLHSDLKNNAGGEKLVNDGAIDLTAVAFPGMAEINPS